MLDQASFINSLDSLTERLYTRPSFLNYSFNCLTERLYVRPSHFLITH